ncbi:hypothetical protein EDD16DRAFT_1551080 [Pisolithus croceorrhizus]|nr:hypothetical protein EDD16DRAFT_1551080 [Pisolithus croceorrhizus]
MRQSLSSESSPTSPFVPACVMLIDRLIWDSAYKGNETHIGNGKGTFEFWAARVPTGRVISEIGGTPIREEFSREGKC